MNYKRTLVTIVICLLLSVLAISISRSYGVSLKDIFAGLFVYALYGLLLIFYLLRFALIFLGVFAVYRILRQRHYMRMAV